MIKKTLIFILCTLLLSILGAYFFYAHILEREGIKGQLLKNIEVVILDSLESRIIPSSEVESIIRDYLGKGKEININDIDVNKIESLLNIKSAIKSSQVSLTREGVLTAKITQREPIVRIETKNGGFYIDESQYIFPLVDHFTSYVPIVNGDIPLHIESKYRGRAQDDLSSWIPKILELAKYINSDPFWESQIEQIYIEKGGDVILYPRVGDHKIIFGELKDINDKFHKLYLFYKNVIPEKGWNRYKSVNLEYKDQIVCKFNKDKKR